MEPLELKIEDIKRWIAEKKGEDITTFNVTEKSSFTDYFVICSAKGSIHTKAIAENVLEQAKKKGYSLLGKEGFDAGVWILLDYGDVIVHFFDAPNRDQYKLEELWQKQPTRNSQEG